MQMIFIPDFPWNLSPFCNVMLHWLPFLTSLCSHPWHNIKNFMPFTSSILNFRNSWLNFELSSEMKKMFKLIKRLISIKHLWVASNEILTESNYEKFSTLQIRFPFKCSNLHAVKLFPPKLLWQCLRWQVCMLMCLLMTTNWRWFKQ